MQWALSFQPQKDKKVSIKITLFCAHALDADCSVGSFFFDWFLGQSRYFSLSSSYMETLENTVSLHSGHQRVDDPERNDQLDNSVNSLRS